MRHGSKNERMASDDAVSRLPSHFSLEQERTKSSIAGCSDAERKCWYAVRCKARQEHIAVMNIDRAGIATFLPQITESKSIRQKVVWSLSPLFPGYLFAKFNAATDYRTVKYSRGVHGIVSFGISPAVIDEEIKIRLNGGLTDANNHLMNGQLVRIQSGPLHGMEAIFERRIPPHQRAVLLLRTISFRAKLVMDLEDIVNL
jgi:transcriptional antiterminator RfaH